MKKICMTGLLLSVTSFLLAQKTDAIINEKEVQRVETKLASDDMRGRKHFPRYDRAADFIANEFKAAGLQPWSKQAG